MCVNSFYDVGIWQGNLEYTMYLHYKRGLYVTLYT